MRLKRFVNISKNTKIKLVVLLAILFVFLFLFFGLNRFCINEVVLVNSEPKLKLIGISSFKKRNILFLKPEEVEKELLEKNSNIQSIDVVKKYPDKLILEVTKDTALAVIKCDTGYFLVSEAGKVIKKQKEIGKNLPLINHYQRIYYSNYQAGQTLDYQEIISVLRILKTIKSIGLQVDSVDINGTHMVAFNLEEKQIIFSLEKDIAEQEYQLETIVHQFRIEGKDFISLDLRFNKPVIKLK